MANFVVMYRETANSPLKKEELSGSSELLLRNQLEAGGAQVILIQAAGRTPFQERIRKLTKAKIGLPRFGVSVAELGLMCEVFGALYSAKIQMVQIVEMTIAETPNPWLRKKLIIVLEHLKIGEYLSTAMSDSRCVRAFPILMRETIKTGEMSGKLEQSFQRLVNTFKRMTETRQQMISAIMYPAFTFIVFMGVCTILAIMIPNALIEFIGEDMMTKVRSQLPRIIQWLFEIRDHPGWLLLPPCILGGIIVLWLIGMRYRPTRHALTRIQRRIPLIGNLLHHIAIVRFLEVLTANHESGIPLGQSLLLVRDSVGDALIEESLTRIHTDVMTTGVGLATVINQPEEIPVYPGLVRQMIRAGDESGQLTKMLVPIIEFYNNQVNATIKRALDLVTPIMIVLLGSVIGPIVLGVYKTIIILQEGYVGGLGG